MPGAFDDSVRLLFTPRLRMLSFQDFFAACAGRWTTERIYHYTLTGEIERSYTEFRVQSLEADVKQRMLSLSELADVMDVPQVGEFDRLICPGFAIAFDTRSETGEEVSMQLNALFVPDTYLATAPVESPLLPLAAEVAAAEDVIQGFYLRDEGYSEAGAIAGRFTYQPTRQTLEMTTYYRRSVAVDQMRFVAPDLRLRTIVTYQRPAQGERPSIIDLIGFGVEHKQEP